MTPPETAAGVPLDPARAGLKALYLDLQEELARHAPVCVLSGKCCRFQEYGHTLFLSALEMEHLLAEAPPAFRPLDEGATCPWQDPSGRCTAREARPLGCRVYYCDPGFQDRMNDVAEAHVSRLKMLSERYGRPWSYAPLHVHLRAASAEGRWVSPTVAAAGAAAAPAGPRGSELVPAPGLPT